MEKEFLSKYKYIYLVYPCANSIQIDRKKIIYINKEYVYYKDSNSFLLDYINMRYVYDHVDEKALFNLGSAIVKQTSNTLYFLFPIVNSKELCDQARSVYEHKTLSKQLEDAENNFNFYKKQYEQAQIKLAELKMKEQND